MLSLKFILDVLHNDFSNGKIISKQYYTDAEITSGKITSAGINEILPIGVYVKVDGTTLNDGIYKIETSGPDYIGIPDLVDDIKTEFSVKVCFIPKEVLDFSLVDHKIPSLDSESIGNYSYSTSTPGAEGFIKSNLSPYYQAVRFV